MKKKLFIFLFILCFGFVKAQDSTQNKFILEGGEYVKLSHPDGSISSEGYVIDGEPEGWWKSYDIQGGLISEGNRKNHLLDGIWTFYKNGKKTSEITYLKGIKQGFSKYYTSRGREEEFYINDTINGLHSYYDTNGVIIKTIPFIKGEKHGMAKEYNKSGEIVYIRIYRRDILVSKEAINRRDKFEKKQDIWKEFYASDKLYWEVTYKDSLKNGYYKEYDTLGNIIKIEKYNMGVLEKDAPELAKVEVYTEYFSNGKPRLRVGYKNGKPEGICREYDSVTGKVTRGTLFKDGEVIGGGIIDDNGYFQDDWKEYYANGTLRCEGKYRKGKRSGIWKYYYADGSVEQEGEYVNGKYEGRWIWYYPDGNIKIQQEYYKGLPDGQMEEFNEKGERIAFGKYIEGLEDGEWEYINESERLQGKYRSGEKSGVWKSYWSTKGKNLSFRGSYIDGQPNGTHFYYWENGKLREEAHYSMGRMVGTLSKYDEMGNLIVKVAYNSKEEEVKYNGKRTLDKEDELEKEDK